MMRPWLKILSDGPSRERRMEAVHYRYMRRSNTLTGALIRLNEAKRVFKRELRKLLPL